MSSFDSKISLELRFIQLKSTRWSTNYYFCSCALILIGVMDRGKLLWVKGKTTYIQIFQYSLSQDVKLFGHLHKWLTGWDLVNNNCVAFSFGYRGEIPIETVTMRKGLKKKFNKHDHNGRIEKNRVLYNKKLKMF